MKKKLLSVLMAGALVATSSVNAFADTVITGLETEEYKANVNITGDVENESGEVKPGTLNVTVPTSAAFTVDKNGSFSSADITIKNGGTQSVDVFAYEFTDINGSEGIKILGTDEVNESVDRTNISLNVQGNRGVAYLGSTLGTHGKGIYSDKELQTAVDTDNNAVKLSAIPASSQDSLKLSATVGSSGDAVEKAVQDNFTLVLKIAKSK